MYQICFSSLCKSKKLPSGFFFGTPDTEELQSPQELWTPTWFWLMRCRMGGIQISELNFKKQPTEKVTSVGIRASNTGSDVDLDGKPD